MRCEVALAFAAALASGLGVGCSLERSGTMAEEGDVNAELANFGTICDPPNCDDGNPCTDDACTPQGCQHAPNRGDCNDRNFCNGFDTCTDGSCSEHGGDPCPGQSFCAPEDGVCRGCKDNSDCPQPAFGSWSTCDYGGFCDETATRSRTVTAFACVAGTCEASERTETENCTRNTDNLICGNIVRGNWSSCENFSGVCDETGQRTRPVTVPTCRNGSCENVTDTETGACTRDTDSVPCGSENCTDGPCEGFSSLCDESGTLTRACTQPTCMNGRCENVSSSDTVACSRNTDGNDCGTSCDNFGPCSYSGFCAENGTQERTCTDLECTGGSCASAGTRTETQNCSRNSREGFECDRNEGPYGTCEPVSVSGGLCEHERTVDISECMNEMCEFDRQITEIDDCSCP